MGIGDALRRLRGPRREPVVVSGGVSWTLADEVMGMPPGELWASQPHLRTVVSFLARNVAQLGLHTFRQVSETDRQRVRDGPLVELWRRPNPAATRYELLYGLVADRALHDIAYVYVGRNRDAAAGWECYRLPPPWVTPGGGDAFSYDEFGVRAPGSTETVTLPAESVLVFPGWSPADPRVGVSPVRALKEILAEQMLAVRHRRQVWQRGGRVSSVLSRPADAPRWSDSARDSFRADWNSNYTGTGPKAGGTPILEDGMTLQRVDFNAHESQFVEGSTLSLSTVASVFHVNPTMVGVLDDANYSNVREFRRMLYVDTLGPELAAIEDRLNTFLVPRVEDRSGVYVEFNIAEKLQGNFEEQTQALQSAVGRPWMTANEARARQNLPALPGDADELVTPLNVLVGGQASPRDVQKRAVVEQHVRRVAAVVKSRLGAGTGWWSDRWDTELAVDLAPVVGDVVAEPLARAVNRVVREGIERDGTVDVETLVATAATVG